MKRFVKLTARVLSAATLIGLMLALGVFAGCKKENGLLEYVSELRSDVFAASSEKYDISAAYGFKEEPFLNDGKVGERVYRLNFSLKGAGTDVADRSICMAYKGEEYKSEFKLNPLTGVLSASFEIENFELKEFTASLLSGAENETLCFKSELPEGTLSLSAALTALEKAQPTLIESYKDENGNFTAEIYARVIVKDGAAFWYIGFAEGNGKLKALLVSGATGEVLAVREIM